LPDKRFTLSRALQLLLTNTNNTKLFITDQTIAAGARTDEIIVNATADPNEKRKNYG
jgi:hypothetical protein